MYDQSVEVVAVLPTLSPQSTLPAEYPLSPSLAVSTTLSPPALSVALSMAPLSLPRATLSHQLGQQEKHMWLLLASMVVPCGLPLAIASSSKALL